MEVIKSRLLLATSSVLTTIGSLIMSLGNEILVLKQYHINFKYFRRSLFLLWLNIFNAKQGRLSFSRDPGGS